MAGMDKYTGYVVLASFLWGTSFVSAKLGVDNMDPVLFTVLRFALGAGVLLAASISLRRVERRLFVQGTVVAIALLNAVAYLFQHLALELTTATNTMLLIDINVIFVAIVASAVLHEAVDRRVAAAIVIGVAGVALVATEGDLSSLGSGSFLGNLIAFSAGLIWAFFIVFQKKVMVRESNVLGVTTAVIVETTLILLVFALLFTRSTDVNAMGLANVLYTGILCSGVAFLAYNAGLRKVEATASALILLMEVVFGIGLAVIILAEYPNWATASGAGLICIAILVSNWPRPKSN